MSFVYRCLATNNPKKPFVGRCKKTPMKNGILCQDHYDQAKNGKIYVLMHNEVSKNFGVPFKNQVCVSIDLSNKVVKPETKSSQNIKIDIAKEALRASFHTSTIPELKAFHDALQLDCWVEFKSNNASEYAFKYFMVKKIINALMEKSVKIK